MHKREKPGLYRRMRLPLAYLFAWFDVELGLLVLRDAKSNK
jgi:hypothetical protein